MTVRTIRLTLPVNGNAHVAGSTLAAFLFERCPGNVAEAGVLAFLRLCREEARAFPGTGAGHKTKAMQRLLAVVED